MKNKSGGINIGRPACKVSARQPHEPSFTLGDVLLNTIVVAALLTVGACAPKEQAFTYIPPPPDADLRPLTVPVLETVDEPVRGNPGDYPSLISNILAFELSTIFDLPKDAESMVQAQGVEDLVPVFDAVTEQIVIPMVFDALDQQQKAVIAEARPWVSLGNREHLYRSIIDLAMARVWQVASGDVSDKEGYLQHLATRSDAASFLAWRGVEGVVWKERITQHLQPSGHPFAVLGMMTSHYLYTHTFSIIGYLVARSFGGALIDSGTAAGADERSTLQDIDELTATLMNSAMLPLMGVDSLLSMAEHQVGHSEMPLPYGASAYAVSENDDAARWQCARWRFFQTATQHVSSNLRAAHSQNSAYHAHADRMAMRLREQEGRVGRRLSSFLPRHVENPIRFAGLDVGAWEALSMEPVSCAYGRSFEMAADADSGTPQKAIPNNYSCSKILSMIDMISDDQIRMNFCQLAEHEFPVEAKNLLLTNLANGRVSKSELSAIFVGLHILQDKAKTNGIEDSNHFSRELLYIKTEVKTDIYR